MRAGARRAPPALALAALAAVALAALPLPYLVVRAFEGGGRAWEVLARERTLELLADTMLLAAAVTALALVLGVPLAWLVTRSDLPGRRLFAVAAALPLVVPSYVAALALIAAFGPRGLLQQLLEGPFGVERVPEIYGFPGALVALAISTYPYVFLLTAAALRSADPALEDAARGLGRSPLQTFRRVTLPLLRPSVGAGALLVALYSLSDFGAVSLMQYDSLTRAIFLQYRALFDRAPAAVLSLVLVALTAVVLVLELRARGRGRVVRTAAGAARPPQPVPLGRWRWPALAFCGLVVGLGLAVPVAVLGYWLARADSLGALLGGVWEPVAGSVLVALAAAAAALAAALPVGLLSARYPAAWTQVLERVSYGLNALPGIVIALALVFFAANYASPLYGTLGLLVVAYVVRFLPQAVAGVQSALVRVPPTLEEAAQGLGRSPRVTFLAVTAPLIAPGLLAGAALVFLSTLKELPATLLLKPIGFETLATEVWSKTAVGSYSEAAVPALLLIVVAIPLVAALARRGGSAAAAPG